MDEQQKYEVIKALVDHPDTGNKERTALKLGCTKRHINRMLAGYQAEGKAFFVHGREDKLNDGDIITKEKVAVKYCEVLSNWTKANGLKEWRYIFIPSKEIQISSSFASPAERFFHE